MRSAGGRGTAVITMLLSPAAGLNLSELAEGQCALLDWGAALGAEALHP